jgi:hypothetical protein
MKHTATLSVVGIPMPMPLLLSSACECVPRTRQIACGRGQPSHGAPPAASAGGHTKGSLRAHHDGLSPAGTLGG